MLPRYSPSTLNDFVKCPYFFKVFHLDGRKKELERPKPYYTLGRVVHQALSDFFTLFLEERNLEKLHYLYRQAWRAIPWEGRGFTDKEEERKYGLRGLNMLEWFHQNYDQKTRPKHLENFYEYILPNGTTLVGKVDRIDEHSDFSVTIIDYKTGSLNFDDEEMPANLQAGIYALLVERKLNRTIREIKFIFLEEKKESSFSPDDGYVKQIEENVQKKIEEIENITEFLPRKSPLCKYCDVLVICPEKNKILKNNIPF